MTQLGFGLTLNLMLAVLEGAVFALLLFVVFTAGFLEGPFFPKFVFDGADDGTSWLSYMNGWTETNEDIGKAIAWAFLAGFSERLVPDLLRQLSPMGQIKGRT